MYAIDYDFSALTQHQLNRLIALEMLYQRTPEEQAEFNFLSSHVRVFRVTVH